MKNKSYAARETIKAVFLIALAACIFVLGKGQKVHAAEEFSITISGENVEDGHTYEAYQIFTGELHVDEEKNAVLCNIQWGEGVDSASLLKALKK